MWCLKGIRELKFLSSLHHQSTLCKEMTPFGGMGPYPCSIVFAYTATGKLSEARRHESKQLGCLDAQVKTISPLPKSNQASHRFPGAKHGNLWMVEECTAREAPSPEFPHNIGHTNVSVQQGMRLRNWFCLLLVFAQPNGRREFVLPCPSALRLRS